jgi:DNA polymerase-3 subunit gamma/tau
MLGAVDRGHAVRLVEALAAGDGRAVVAGVDGLRSLGLSAAGTLEEMAALLQQMAVLQAVPDAADVDDPDAPATARLAQALAPDETQLLYSIVLHGRAELGLAPDEYSALVMVLLRMLAFRPAGQGGRPEVVAPPASAPVPSRPAVAAAPAVTARPAPAARPVAAARPAVVVPAPAARVVAPVSSEPPPWLDVPDADQDAPAQAVVAREPAPPVVTSAAAAPFTPTPLGDRWTRVARHMAETGAIGALVRELAMQAQCIGVDESSEPMTWTVRVERETLRSTANCDKLQAALAEAVKKPVRLVVEAGPTEDTPARRDALERARRQAEAEQIIHDDPLVQALMAQYKTARIVPGSVKPH